MGKPRASLHLAKCISTLLFVAQLAGTPVDAASGPKDSSRLFRLASSQFEEPLVATASTSRKEDDALLEAIQAYLNQSARDDFRPLDAFLSDYPRSGWRVALLTNLGLSYYHYGYFSRAIDAWGTRLAGWTARYRNPRQGPGGSRRR